MTAIIVENGAEYVSPVFAIKRRGWYTEVLAFDRQRTHIKRIRMWYPRRQVFIVDRGEFDCKRSAWEGYGWVLEDKKLWKAMRFGNKADTEDFPQFKEYSKEIVLPEWFEIRNEKDIQTLTDVSMAFHDSVLVRVETRKNDTEIEFDTTRGCFITVKFEGVQASGLIDSIGMICDSSFEKTESGYIWKVTSFDSGKAGVSADVLPVSGEPYIACDSIKWQVKIGDGRYRSQSKKYDGLYDLYCDLKAVSENVILKGDQLILHHKKDTLVIEESPQGYRTYLNGKKERGEWEAQDILYYADDFLTQFNPEDITEEILADVVSVKPLYVWHSMKYALLFSVLWSAMGLVLVFLARMHWVLFAVLFAALSLFVLVFLLFSSIKETRYIVTATKIYYFDQNNLNRVLDISQIRKIRLYRSLIKKGVGTLKIKVRQKGELTFGCGLIAVKEAEKIYDLIRQNGVL